MGFLSLSATVTVIICLLCSSSAMLLTLFSMVFNAWNVGEGMWSVRLCPHHNRRAQLIAARVFGIVSILINILSLLYNIIMATRFVCDEEFIIRIICSDMLTTLVFFVIFYGLTVDCFQPPDKQPHNWSYCLAMATVALLIYIIVPVTFFCYDHTRNRYFGTNRRPGIGEAFWLHMPHSSKNYNMKQLVADKNMKTESSKTSSSGCPDLTCDMYKTNKKKTLKKIKQLINDIDHLEDDISISIGNIPQERDLRGRLVKVAKQKLRKRKKLQKNRRASVGAQKRVSESLPQIERRSTRSLMDSFERMSNMHPFMRIIDKRSRRSSWRPPSLHSLSLSASDTDSVASYESTTGSLSSTLAQDIEDFVDYVKLKRDPEYHEPLLHTPSYSSISNKSMPSTPKKRPFSDFESSGNSSKSVLSQLFATPDVQTNDLLYSNSTPTKSTSAVLELRKVFNDMKNFRPRPNTNSMSSSAKSVQNVLASIYEGSNLSKPPIIVEEESSSSVEKSFITIRSPKLSLLQIPTSHLMVDSLCSNSDDSLESTPADVEPLKKRLIRPEMDEIGFQYLSPPPVKRVLRLIDSELESEDQAEEPSGSSGSSGTQEERRDATGRMCSDKCFERNYGKIISHDGNLMLKPRFEDAEYRRFRRDILLDQTSDDSYLENTIYYSNNGSNNSEMIKYNKDQNVCRHIDGADLTPSPCIYCAGNGTSMSSFKSCVETIENESSYGTCMSPKY